MEPNYVQHILEAAQWISDRIDRRTLEFGLVLGSGLGDLAGQVEDPVVLPYDAIPHFPVSTVEGHAGQFVIGRLEGRQVIVMQGRFHYYEGYSMKKVVFPIYVMKQLGVRSLLITNAAGGMNRGFQAGDLMLISDHLNLTGDNPLIGIHHPELGVRFPDMSQAYSREYRALARRIADRMSAERGEAVRLQEGVYAGITGPNYLPPVELTMLAKLGGDAVGMSTVGEVIAASHAGLRVLGISCITDMAIGEELEPLTHEQVVAVANRTRPVFIELVKRFVAEAPH
ncbi:purine-nucleoside phosphorylase [Paenibacillus mucilaginosus]|uniref:Purine nucleoside phosphorylase n=1 Tax=Paenibacillus mucilaginosus (strain KNP414) TaxID=1036673 RepID=F8F8C2_PAEMK|nr:purine-nucleoside phosphorylase [Paenibacillus mucilaginosus]AEI41269.1 PunA2 [Paenibacillus mucilaginosus KNP414]MCG7211308.1 purine-nucleoside phosphorylase [Paenibacillus mucilaginosus]WDM30302.1 purine-nucleoside phosphorylase [Paenibacillus mucilaginosus]